MLSRHLGDGEQGTVVATAGHPFWVPETSEWVDAGELEPGQWLRTSAGTLVQVSAVEHERRQQTVHNLTVAGDHTYYVAAGPDDVLVHNCGSTAASSASKGRPFAMGMRENLDDFAATHGASTWKNLDDPQNWQAGVLQKLSDPDQRVLFNLDGVDVWASVTRAASGRGGATDWELLQVRSVTFPKLEFWRGGVRVEDPFR